MSDTRTHNNAKFVRWLIEHCNYVVKSKLCDVICLVDASGGEYNVSQDYVDESTWAYLVEQLPPIGASGNAALILEHIAKEVMRESIINGGYSQLRAEIDSWAKFLDEPMDSSVLDNKANTEQATEQNDALKRNAEASSECHGGKGARDGFSDGKFSAKSTRLIHSKANTDALRSGSPVFNCGRKKLNEVLEESKTEQEREHEDKLMVDKTREVAPKKVGPFTI